MFEKLIFSLGSNMNLAMDQATLLENSIIDFGVSLYIFIVTSHYTTLTLVSIGTILEDVKPILHFKLHYDLDFPSLKRKVICVHVPFSGCV